MDLIYQAGGSNQTRLRLFDKTLGAGTISTLSDTNKSVFSIWCCDTPPDETKHVWWKTTGLESVEQIVAYAKSEMSARKNLDIMILEHSSGAIDNLSWCVLVSKDNIVRTFQNEVDVCSHLKELIARYEHQ